jgi:type I restriction enzyme S subunit
MAKQIDSNVPKIRFKGFVADWEEKRLGEVLTERNVLQKITEDAPILAFAAGQGVIPRSERKSNNRDHLTLDQANKLYKLTEYDDLVYNPSNLKYGAIDRNKHGRGVISPIYVTFTTREISSFIEPIIKSEKFKIKALLYEEGTVVKRQSVKPENLLSLDIWITSNPQEQTKIGAFFQYLDRLIGLQLRKHDKLVTLKKAMLQKMLPQPGGTIPEIRFKGFEGEWKKRSLHHLADRYDNLRVPISARNRIPGNTPYYGANGIQDYVQGYTHDGEFILVAEDGASNLKSYPVQYVRGKVWVNNHAHVLKAKDGVSETRFLKYAFSQINVEVFLVGGGRSKLNAETMMQMKLRAPADIEEQQKIGTYFRMLEELISNHAIQLEKLKQLKSACLERMFV